MALGEATQLLNPFKDSLPPIGFLWILISQKGKEPISHASDILSSIGVKLKEFPFVTNNAEKAFKDSLPPIGDLWSLLSQKGKEPISHASYILSSIGVKLKEFPFVTNIAEKAFKVSIPPIGDLWSLLSQKWKEAISHASYILSSIGVKLKEFPFATNIADFAKEGVNLCLLYVKQHPYLLGFGLVLVLGLTGLWLIASILGGGGGSRKTMKAPGREYRMFRDDFEANPRSYFRDLRGKGA